MEKTDSIITLHLYLLLLEIDRLLTKKQNQSDAHMDKKKDSYEALLAKYNSLEEERNKRLKADLLLAKAKNLVPVPDGVDA